MELYPFKQRNKAEGALLNAHEQLVRRPLPLGRQRKMKRLSKQSKWIVWFLVLLATLVVASPVLADWLRPNRTVTTTTSVCHAVLYECKQVNGHWKYKRMEDWSCPNYGDACAGYDDHSKSCDEDSHYSGHEYCTREESTETTTITYDPATISGTLNCTLQNGWCNGSSVPELALHAEEPLLSSGYNITLIEGTLNTVSFACPAGATDCSVPLNEGQNDFVYWALSSWGDGSEKGFSSAKVDTLPPEVALSVTGTLGENGWYVSPITVEAIPSDAASGVATFEAAVDGGGYQSYTAPLALTDGVHTLQFHAVDKAGNPFEAAQTFSVDTIAPTVDLPNHWQIGRNVPYSAHDAGSGLAALRVVIEDEDERYAKVTWDEKVSGNKYAQDIDWNGQFRDKTVAPPGTYLVWIKVKDVAGNEHVELGQVTVPEPNVVYVPPPTQNPAEPLPMPPAELTEPEADASITAPSTNGADGAAIGSTTTTQSLLLTSGKAGANAASSTTSGVLWGAAAAAAVGAATAYALNATRKRKEAEAEQAAQVRANVAADEARRAEGHLTKEEKREQKAQKAEAHDAKVQERRERQSWENPAQEKAALKLQEEQALLAQQEAAIQQAIYNANMDAKAAKNDAEDNARWVSAQMAAQIRRERTSYNPHIDRKTAEYDAQEQADWEAKQKAAEMSQVAARNADMLASLPGYLDSERQAPQEKSWWQRTKEGFENASDRAWLWVDQHQTEIALGIGIAVGVAAIILSAGTATPLVAAAWVAGAALVAAGTTTYGTIVLNRHFGRDWHENLAQNVLLSGLSAAAVTGAWFLFQAATAAIGPLCYQYQAVCGRVEPILNAMDKVEEFWLYARGGYQTLIGDKVGAADTALELQMEYMDGGMPGNSVAKELEEKFGKETLEEIAKYGDEALSLVMLYGDDAAQIITKYGDDGIAVLMKYGDDAIDLIQDHGPRAVKVLQAVDPVHAENLLETLDDDVFDYVLQQGDDAVDALSRWSTKDLSEHGMELALRAKKDAKVLANVKKLVSLKPIDPKHLTKEQQALIDEIAEYSTQYGGEGQVVLGKWVDQGGGFVEVAKDTGSVHYNPHPDLWETLDDLGPESQEDVAWLINKQVVQTGIEKGKPFEYALNDIKPDKIDSEMDAIEKIWEGAPDTDTMYSNIKDALDSDYVPIRMKELIELYNAGYEYSFDVATNSYVLIKP